MPRQVKFGKQVPTDCLFCGQALETFEHLFYDCVKTNSLWQRLCLWLGIRRVIQDWNCELQWINTMAKSKTGQLKFPQLGLL